MLKGIVTAVFVLALIIGGYFLWKQHYATSDLGSGDVVVRKVPADATDSNTAFNNDTDGALPTPSRSDAPGTVNGTPVGSTGAGNQLTTGQTTAPQTGTQPGTVGGTGTMRAPAPDATTTFAQSPTPVSLPVSDSIAPNPPNGAIFAGTGAYQWYRQGNITWRVDSKNGRACIAFATMDEWQKAIVMHNGCGRIV